jgi:hypothetical protein
MRRMIAAPRIQSVAPVYSGKRNHLCRNRRGETHRRNYDTPSLRGSCWAHEPSTRYLSRKDSRARTTRSGSSDKSSSRQTIRPSRNISCHSQIQQPPEQPPDQNEEDHLSGGLCNLLIYMEFMAPEVGLEPTTLRLTAECSAIELLRNSGMRRVLRLRRTTLRL